MGDQTKLAGVDMGTERITGSPGPAEADASGAERCRPVKGRTVSRSYGVQSRTAQTQQFGGGWARGAGAGRAGRGHVTSLQDTQLPRLCFAVPLFGPFSPCSEPSAVRAAGRRRARGRISPKLDVVAPFHHETS